MVRAEREIQFGLLTASPMNEVFRILSARSMIASIYREMAGQNVAHRLNLSDVQRKRKRLASLLPVDVSAVDLDKVDHLLRYRECSGEFYRKSILPSDNTENGTEFVQLIIVVLIVDLDGKIRVDFTCMMCRTSAFVGINEVASKA